MKKSGFEILFRGVLCGLIYEIVYEIALALRWATSEEVYSIVAAAISGVIIAYIMDKRPIITTILGLVTAFGFHMIAVYMNIQWRVLVYFDPYMADIGHTTVNENITILYVSFIYLVVSFFAFVTAHVVKALARENKAESAEAE